MSGQADRHSARRRAVPGPLALDDEQSIGDEALHFTRWFVQSKYRLMGAFLGELQRPPAARDRIVLRERYCRALQHAQRVLRARIAVTLLLALGVVAAAASAIANVLDLGADVAATTTLLERAAAIAASASVLLIALRLALDRYLQRVEIVAVLIAMQLSSAETPSTSPPAPAPP